MAGNEKLQIKAEVCNKIQEILTTMTCLSLGKHKFPTGNSLTHSPDFSVPFLVHVKSTVPVSVQISKTIRD